MTAGPPLVFIGPMGAGKTRVGKRVARLLGAGFRDTDKMIVAAHGPIADLFETHGEPHFRALEVDAVARALAGDTVVALGGGAVLDPGTRALLAAHPVVYLTVSAESVAPRLAGGKRPLVRDGVASWQRIYDERKPLYEALADLTVETSHRSDESIADEVARWARERQASR
jgi:shikimate kinase